MLQSKSFKNKIMKCYWYVILTHNCFIVWLKVFALVVDNKDLKASACDSDNLPSRWYEVCWLGNNMSCLMHNIHHISAPCFSHHDKCLIQPDGGCSGNVPAPLLTGACLQSCCLLGHPLRWYSTCEHGCPVCDPTFNNEWPAINF